MTIKKKTRGAVGIIITKPARDGVWISKRSENLPGERKWYAGYSQVPGGEIDPGETPRQAAVRELTEETGLVAGDSSVAHCLVEVYSGEFTLPDGRPFDSTHYLMITDREPQHTEPDASDAWRYVPIEKLHMLQFMPSTLAAISSAIRHSYLRSPDFTHVAPALKKIDLRTLVKPLKWANTPGRSNSSRVSTNEIGPTYTVIKRPGQWQLVLSTSKVGARADYYQFRNHAIEAANCHFRAIVSQYLKLK